MSAPQRRRRSRLGCSFPLLDARIAQSQGILANVFLFTDDIDVTNRMYFAMPMRRAGGDGVPDLANKPDGGWLPAVHCRSATASCTAKIEAVVEVATASSQIAKRSGA